MLLKDISAMFSLLVLLLSPLGAQAQYEAPKPVHAADFIGETNMQSVLHNVMPEAWNDGHANIYRIESAQHTYEARGTDQARQLIHEIHITAALREKSTAGAALGAAGDRIVNLIETPIRIVNGVIDRGSEISNVGDVILFIPKGAFDITEDLLEGVNEFGVTGVRIIQGAAGTKCSGFGCVEKTGEDIWSGVNSLAGKHNAAREIYAAYDIDPYTDNKILRRQVDRLAYADAYTSTALKFGISGAGIDYLSDYNRGVGYYNNAEFVASYEDAHRIRNREKAVLAVWGLDAQSIEALYTNPAYTHRMRSALAEALAHFSSNPARARFAKQAADAKTRYQAVSLLKTYQYLAHMQMQNALTGFYTENGSAIAIARNGSLIVPISADYLQWTASSERVVNEFAAIRRPTELHILGTASSRYESQAAARGLKVIYVQ